MLESKLYFDSLFNLHLQIFCDCFEEAQNQLNGSLIVQM